MKTLVRSAFVAFTVAAILLLTACSQGPSQGSDEPPNAAVNHQASTAPPHTSSARTPTYIGSETCATCHSEQAGQWQSSHHFHAMELASSASILGDFQAPEFESFGERFRFSSDDGEYRIETTGKDGEIKSYRVSHTFGWHPLQQYLTETEPGRWQALAVAWDSRSLAEGGQKWFHLYPDEHIDHKDVLHWTGGQFNWNHQCADCHATAFEKGFDSKHSNFQSQYSEGTVSCESCHGPGSVHAELAESSFPGGEHGLAAAVAQRATQIEVCAPCHSRREQFDAGFQPGKAYLDFYQASLVRPGLYHADGQIDDEVYVFGSFLQSKMHQAGVVCSDCHQPHSLQLKAQGNAVCTQCHSGAGASRFEGLIEKTYDSKAHHFHSDGSDGAQCVNCHMMAKTYMQVDPRRDHSFRIPRPALAEKLGSPDACTQCHSDKEPGWIKQHYEQQWGEESKDLVAEHFAPAWQGKTTDTDALLAIASDSAVGALRRASAVELIHFATTAPTPEQLRTLLHNAEPMIRLAAASLLTMIPVEHHWPLASHLLSDDFLAVRIAAASQLAGTATQWLSVSERAALAKALAEYEQTQHYNADRGEAQANLGRLASLQGNIISAKAHYQKAITTDPHFIPAYLNLAELHRRTGDDANSLKMLNAALKKAPDNPDAQHALGLWHVRQQQTERALDSLASAASHGNWRHRYVYAIALHSSGSSAEAIKELEDAVKLRGHRPDLLFALATINRDLNQLDQAIEWAKKMLAENPADERAERLLSSLLKSE